MKLLKKISAVSLIILTAALIASCNSSPNAAKKTITEAYVDLSGKENFEDTLTFVIDEEKFVIDDMGGTVEITLESDEDPGYLLTIKLGKNEDEGIYTIGYMNGEESVSSDLEGNSFNVKISYNSSSFSIEINDKEVAPFTEFKNATGITVRCNNVAGESDLDLIYIESVNSDWEITN